MLTLPFLTIVWYNWCEVILLLNENVISVIDNFINLEPSINQLGFSQHPFLGSRFMWNEEQQKYIDILNREDIQSARAKIKNHLQKYIDNDDISTIFYIVDKPYRSAFLKFLYPYLSDTDKALCLKYTWIQTEFQSKDPNISKEQFLKMFQSADPHLLMDEDEFSVFQSLPNEIEIYRGVGDTGYKFGYKGISWILKESVANMFALRFPAKELSINTPPQKI